MGVGGVRNPLGQARATNARTSDPVRWHFPGMSVKAILRPSAPAGNPPPFPPPDPEAQRRVRVRRHGTRTFACVIVSSSNKTATIYERSGPPFRPKRPSSRGREIWRNATRGCVRGREKSAQVPPPLGESGTDGGSKRRTCQRKQKVAGPVGTRPVIVVFFKKTEAGLERW